MDTDPNSALVAVPPDVGLGCTPAGRNDEPQASLTNDALVGVAMRRASCGLNVAVDSLCMTIGEHSAGEASEAPLERNDCTPSAVGGRRLCKYLGMAC